MQLTEHISKAAWSTADRALNLGMGFLYFIPQKVIGEDGYGLFVLAQALMIFILMLSESSALQIIVNFGVVKENRRQAMTVAALWHTILVGAGISFIWFFRDYIAEFTDKPGLENVLILIPLAAIGFLIRNYVLKVAQLFIDTRGTFIIDLVWIGTTGVLYLHGWISGWLTHPTDMMIVSAIASGLSALTGLVLYASAIRFTKVFEKGLFKKMMNFGVAQFGTATMLAIQGYGDVIILGKFVDASLLGNYDVAKKFFKGFEGIRDAGAMFVYPAVARLSSQGRERELATLIEKMMAFMTIIMVPIVLFVWLGPIDYIVDIIYKGRYQDVPGVLRILSLGGLILPFSMCAYVLIGMTQIRKYFWVTFASVCSFFAAALIFLPPFGAYGMAIAVVVSFWVLAILSVYFLRKLMPISARGVISRVHDAREFLSGGWRSVIPWKRRGGKDEM